MRRAALERSGGCRAALERSGGRIFSERSGEMCLPPAAEKCAYPP